MDVFTSIIPIILIIGVFYFLMIMPANKPHSLKAEKKFKMLLVMIKD